MQAPAFTNIVSSAPHSLAFQILRSVALCLIGAQFIITGCKRKKFHYRGGRPMPTWLGRVVLIGFGLFFVGSTFFFWNK
jgi:hypothetical protein